MPSNTKSKLNIKLVLILSIVVATILIFFVVYYRQGDSETMVVYCGPGKQHPVTVFKNPSRAFPAVANDYQISTKAALTLLQAVKDSAPSTLSGNLAFVEKVNLLREQLNQDNIRMENILKASFYSFNQDPCNDRIRERYLNLIDTVAAKTLELERFKASISLPSQKGAVEGSVPILNKDTAIINRSIEQFSEYYFRLWKVECEIDGVLGKYILDTAIARKIEHQKPGHETFIIPD